jgi:hypothetical protein
MVENILARKIFTFQKQEPLKAKRNDIKSNLIGVTIMVQIKNWLQMLKRMVKIISKEKY